MGVDKEPSSLKARNNTLVSDVICTDRLAVVANDLWLA